LRLIVEGGLGEGELEQLADRLGVGARHLRRLFLRHLGAPPRAIVQTRRLHFAKKLIDETNLRMADVALASGFGCVRRFNAAIRRTYKRTPKQIRSLAHQKAPQPENHYEFRLRFRPPYDWDGMLRFLRERSVPGIEVAQQSYRRSIKVNDCPGHFDVALSAGSNELVVRVQIGESNALITVVERIRRMFDLDADWNAIADVLSNDRHLVAFITRVPGMRIPGCWDAFEMAVRAILGERTHPRSTSLLVGKIVRHLGERLPDASDITHLFPTAAVLARADLMSFGVSARRARALRALALAVDSGELSFAGVSDGPAFLQHLRKITGMDPACAQYIAMRGLGEPDALLAPGKDTLSALGVEHARALEQRAEAWRPWRSYAAMYLHQPPAVY
jgi:AraC family transcriptional regulator of adaptative response / DNA-3-methyladenine glycosylase II